ncbi:unnamed protein product [Blumeria hordei]|uniref:Coupling of ubiquitin conjugation to ER degradation protein 1 n=1 Tax=Blumeria hordei TaxID=2867405 RepID=A0A383UQF3_BLUHO|nr:unnamed protein product [Blumeria hordei]
MAEQIISLPQLLLLLLLGGVTIRYFVYPNFVSSSPSSQQQQSSRRLRAREADIERVQQMFPQLARRSIMWDLQRNGGNVAATTERILSGRGLDTPPPSFQPILPNPPPQPSSANTPETSTSPNLITRYNLAAKITEKPPPGKVADELLREKQSSVPAWSANKADRQALLQRRREEMILAARRKMEARVAAEEAAAQRSPSTELK